MYRIVMLCVVCAAFVLGGCGLSVEERRLVGVWGIEVEDETRPRETATDDGVKFRQENLSKAVATSMRIRFFDDRVCESEFGGQSLGASLWRVRGERVEFRASSPNAQKATSGRWVHGMAVERGGRLVQLDESSATRTVLVKLSDDPSKGLPVAVDVGDLSERSIQGRWITDLKRTRAAMHERGIDIDQPETDRERQLSCLKEDVLILQVDGQGSLNDDGLRWAIKDGGIEFDRSKSGSSWIGRLDSGRLVMPNGFVFKKIREMDPTNAPMSPGLR